MNQFEGLLLLFGLSTGLLLAGYWLAALMDTATPATRLAVALLAGLGSLLFTVSVVNFFAPLAGGWALLCLAPVGVTLAGRASRTRWWHDLAALRTTPGAYRLAGLGVLFFLVLLWPILSDGQRIFYDGTSNHDSFFWISAAEHLKRHSYMVPPVHSDTQPLTNTAGALVGWTPIWGRMGAEGLLALSSSLSWTSPLKLYVYAPACLFLPWLAAVYLAVRTFCVERLSLGAKAVLIALQPLYVFYYSNANLPNLLGAVTGAAVVLSTERILRPPPGSAGSGRPWWGLLVLSFHGLICSYPEMVPFVLLPCGLLWLRPWLSVRWVAVWRPGLAVAAAIVAAAVINPATTIRAVSGFTFSFESARANQSWVDIFESLTPAEFIPGLATLSVPAARHLGNVLGALVTLALAVSLGFAWRRSRDRFGTLAVFAGSLALAVYTTATGFQYGWQKTVQFAGVFFAAIPVAAFDPQRSAGGATGSRRWLARAGLGLMLGFLGFAVAMNCREIYKSSSRKVLSQDWFSLRELSYGPLRDAPVLVEAASFRMGFFYSMWAAYFLPESQLYFGVRGDDSGGYLRDDIVREGRRPVPKPKAILVGRAWADTFDANSPRLETGREFALLVASNRVLDLQGVYPLYGVPEYSSTSAELEIRPHSESALRFDLAPRRRGDWPSGTWRVERRVEGTPDVSVLVTGAPPWRIDVPLLARRRNHVTVRFSAEDKSGEPYPFILSAPRVGRQP